MGILNLREVADRINLAINQKEKIILFADADLDGVASLLILQEAIYGMGGTVNLACFPNREEEGYGLNLKALGKFKNEAPALLITLDCGISNFEEIKQAKKDGFTVIVVDHHQVLGKVPPEAFLVVDPKQEGDLYPFKNLSNTGIVYHLAKLVMGGSFSNLLNQSFLELATLATIADMMEEQQDNKMIIEKGLSTIIKTQRPGLLAIVEVCNSENLSVRQVVQKIIGVLNITEFKKGLPENYSLLSMASFEEAGGLAERLNRLSKERYLVIGATVAMAEQIISEDPTSFEKIIFLGKDDWVQVLTGAIASRLCNKYQKPTFVFKISKEIIRGSLRTPRGVDGVTALKQCHKYLEMYGGHQQAAGFSLKTKNLEKFRKCLLDFFNQ
ncbi:MAG: DHH family phosphoesterase [Candidatus Gribaldobacteria bacterium]|nr:DHH family phosphoesterase [Candidatus Gribaldobacteria bacterium]